jgi:[CysO sulfur-carrier protein]-S-L-cysteine hydrolase
MKISRALLEEIVAHAQAEAPNECVGMVASEDGRAVEVHPAVNAAASPLRYEIDPADQYRIEMAIESAGRDLGAIYHSHTRSAPYPSQTDVNLAFHPHALYVIVGLASGEPEVRAYRIVDGRIDAAELEVQA